MGQYYSAKDATLPHLSLTPAMAGGRFISILHIRKLRLREGTASGFPPGQVAERGCLFVFSLAEGTQKHPGRD